MPNTASPTAKRVTPTPTASTVPATSHPTVNGGGPITLAIPPPARVFQSTGLTPAAATRTRISVGNGSGTGARPISSTSGPPVVRWVTMRMLSTGGMLATGQALPAEHVLLRHRDRVVGRRGGLRRDDRDRPGLHDADRVARPAVPRDDPLDIDGVAVVLLDGGDRGGDRRDLLVVQDATVGQLGGHVDLGDAAVGEVERRHHLLVRHVVLQHPPVGLADLDVIGVDEPLHD